MERINDSELKTHLLEMMKWFHSFCVENHIRYYALGGTMLGAVRHQGFIPWDDDLDVGVVSEDYIKLPELISNSGQSRFAFESPDTDAPDYFYSFSKLYDTSTTLVENTKFRIRRGIYIDIFPLVGMGNTETESAARFKVIDGRFRYLLARTTGIRKGRSTLKNLAVYVLRLIPGFLSRDKAKLISLNHFANEKAFYENKFGGNPFGAWRYKEIMDSAIMGNPTLYKFEDLFIYGAEHANEYLTHLYGDWRQLPPPEKRFSVHDYIEIDLHKSYLQKF